MNQAQITLLTEEEKTILRFAQLRSLGNASVGFSVYLSGSSIEILNGMAERGLLERYFKLSKSPYFRATEYGNNLSESIENLSYRQAVGK